MCLTDSWPSHNSKTETTRYENARLRRNVIFEIRPTVYSVTVRSFEVLHYQISGYGVFSRETDALQFSMVTKWTDSVCELLVCILMVWW